MRIIFNAGRFTKNINLVVDNATRAISDALFEDIKKRSPVRSGLFRDSWRKSGSKMRYKISNPQPYAGALERGRSRQAPDGVVRPAIENIKQPIRRYR
jgi:hypothetical protein